MKREKRRNISASSSSFVYKSSLLKKYLGDAEKQNKNIKSSKGALECIFSKKKI